MLRKSVVILGVSHRVQVDDPDAPFKTFDDPDYKKIVRNIISNENIDFVGEEAGNKKTHAEVIALELLGAGHYLNINPSAEEDVTLGVAMPCHGALIGEPSVMYWSIEKIERREAFWVDRIAEANPTRGLLICGCFHTFSAAAKLLNRGFEAKTRTYMPWNRLAE